MAIVKDVKKGKKQKTPKIKLGLAFYDELRGSLGKRKKLGIPLTRLDIKILTFGKKIILGKKAYPPQRVTILQRQTRERFKEADCIYWRMSKSQRYYVKLWGQELEKRYRYGLKPYHYWMQRVLTNYMPDLLKNYFCVDLDEITMQETDTSLIFTTRLIQTKFVEDPFAFFERIPRRY
jgi:hypothetical protein